MTDRLPRTYQADIHRLHATVLRPALAALPLVGLEPVEDGETYEDRLDRLASHVAGHTALEVRKAFVLTLAAVFERQVRTWAAQRHVDCGGQPIPTVPLDQLLRFIDGVEVTDSRFALQAATLQEMHWVANVVRHGEGSSARSLRLTASQLWTCEPNASRPDSGMIPDLMITDPTIEAYVAAIIRFWGVQDREFGAIFAEP